MARSLPTTTRTLATTVRDVLSVSLVVLLALFSTATSARADVPLLTAEPFAVLAGETVTNTGLTTITGDIGISPGSALADTGTISLDGTVHAADGVALQAQTDLTAAYLDAAGRTPSIILPELDGQDLGPGVYASTGGGAFLLSTDGILTLTGDADDVWIFQSGSTLTFMSDSSVVFEGDADPCNVFWQVTSSATLGTDAMVIGTIMALASITLETGAELQGRALARTGSVTMDANTITASICAQPVDDETPPPADETPPPAEEAPAEEAPAQVQQVPSGAVAAGGQPVSTTGPLFLPVVAVIALLILAGVLFTSIRERGRT
jgi:hypothetical protein